MLLAGAMSVTNPLFESTDEIRHYRYVRYLVVEHQLPVQGAETVRSQSHHPPLYYLLSALASGWVPSPHTPEFDQPGNPFWGYRNWEVGVDNKLQYLHSPAEYFPFREGYLAAMIPRWVNILFGALTVFLTYKLSRSFWDDDSLALAAALLVALNPQFIYLSAAINNDIAAAATGAWTLYLCVRVAQARPRFGQLLLLGISYGLALLAKLHLAAFGAVIALALYLSVSHHAEGKPAPTLQERLRRGLPALGTVLGVALLIAGWWFWRNWRLYGDPTGLNMVNALWSGRPAQGNWWALRQGLPYLWASLWGRFGYGQIPLPQWIYTGLLAFCGAALTGYFVPRRDKLPDTLSLLLLSSALFLGVVGYYILIQPAGPMGRFLFPVLPAFAVLVVGGAQRWAHHSVITLLVVAFLMLPLVVVALFGYLWPAVGYPPQATEPFPGQPVQIQFGNLARVLAVDVQPAAAQPGESVLVTVVWEPLQWTPTPYTVFIHLLDEADTLIAQRDTWPGLGRAPTTIWKGQHPFVDVYRVELPDTTYAPNRLHVELGLYEACAGRVPAFDQSGTLLGDSIAVGAVDITPRPGPWPNTLNANFGNEITLLGYTLEPRELAPGDTLTLTLYWQPQHPLSRDYQVFAQALDDAYNVWGSQDGVGPGWTSGEVVRDMRHITLRPDTPPGSYPIQVGLFHSETGRLPVIAPEGWYYLDERVVLGPIKVK